MFKRVSDAAAWRYERNVLPRTSHGLVRDPLLAEELLTERCVMLCHLNRSGGNLLMRLFDNHPDCNVWPYNFKIGRHLKNWDEDQWMTDEEFSRLPKSKAWLWSNLVYDERFTLWRRNGYVFKWDNHDDSKPIEMNTNSAEIYAAFSHLYDYKFSGKLDVKSFVACVFAAYQYGWRNGKNRNTDKLFNVWFSMNHYSYLDHVSRFISTHSVDAKIVTLFREPASYLASALEIGKMGYDQAGLIKLYENQARDIAEAKERFGDQIKLVRFEDLVQNRKSVMDDLADWIGITPSSSLYEPTFNGESTRPNTSFTSDNRPIEQQVVSRGEKLTDEARTSLDASDMAACYDRLLRA